MTHDAMNKSNSEDWELIDNETPWFSPFGLWLGIDMELVFLQLLRPRKSWVSDIEWKRGRLFRFVFFLNSGSSPWRNLLFLGSQEQIRKSLGLPLLQELLKEDEKPNRRSILRSKNDGELLKRTDMRNVGKTS